MRKLHTVSLAALLCSLATAGCVPKEHPEPDWMKAPPAYQPKTADLTFNEEKLKAFVMMSPADREAHIKTLQETAGSMKGMAIHKSGAALGEKMADAKHGEWEATAVTDEVLWDITIEYAVFTTEASGQKLAPNAAIEFSGQLVELDFRDDQKPRKLSLKVKADSVEQLKH